MSEVEAKRKYCIDSSSLITLKQFNPISLYPSVWHKIDEYINDGRICCPEQVYDEILAGSDELGDWVKPFKLKMVHPMTAQLWEATRPIMEMYPLLVKSNDERDQADPYIISLAIQEKLTIITQEKPKGPHKISYACKELGIEFMNIHEFFTAEAISF